MDQVLRSGSTMRHFAVLIAIACNGGRPVASAESVRSTVVQETISFARAGNFPVVTVSISGQKLKFVVNTAVKQTLIAERHRELLGARREAQKGDSRDGRDPEIEIYRAPPIYIGRFALIHDGVGVIETTQIEEENGVEIDGFIGTDAFKDIVVQFDFQNSRLQLSNEIPNDAGHEVPIFINEDGISTVELRIGTEIPRLFIPATMLAAPVTIRNAVFASLCDAGILTLSEPMKLALAHRGEPGIRGVAPIAKLGQLSERQIPVETDDAEYLGLDYLSRYTVTFDYPHQRAYFKKTTLDPFPNRTDKSGLLIKWRKNGIVVDAVSAGSPAADCGVLRYDVILRANGKPTENLSLFQLRRLLQDDGNKVALTLERDGRRVDVTLALQDYQDHQRLRQFFDPNSAPPTEPRVLDEFDIARGGAPIVLPIHLRGAPGPLLMLLDTGASRSCFDPRIRASLGKSLGFCNVNTPLGRLAEEEVRVPAAALGKVELSKETVGLLTDLTMFREDIGLDIDGIIGIEYLSRQFAEIDFDRGKFRLLSGVPVDPGNSIPIEYTLSGTPAMRLTFARAHSDWFVIDTGWLAGATGVKRDSFATLLEAGLISNTTRSRHRDALRSPAVVGSISSVELGPYLHNSVRLVTCDYNTVGLEYLSRYHVVLDFPKMQLHLKKGNRYDCRDRIDMSGLLIVKRDGRMTIDAVRRLAAGDIAGCKIGDRITRCNSHDADRLSVFEVREMLCAKGETVKLSIRRGGEDRELTLNLKEIGGKSGATHD